MSAHSLVDARPRASAFLVAPAWVCAFAVVLAQITYSMTDPAERGLTTTMSVVAFAAASLLDAAARCGPRAALVLALAAGGGGLLAEAVGLLTGFPFGEYDYTGTLGAEVLGVPALVPLAWTMMAWPAALVGRTLGGRGWAVVAVAGWALASWDVFLDPQMVDAGHWVWAHPEPGLPGVAGIPLTNFAGWLLVALLVGAALSRVTAPRADLRLSLGPAPVLYLWTFGSSVWAHAAFFERPWVSLVGGVAMGLVALPFAWALWRAHR